MACVTKMNNIKIGEKSFLLDRTNRMWLRNIEKGHPAKYKKESYTGKIRNGEFGVFGGKFSNLSWNISHFEM